MNDTIDFWKLIAGTAIFIIGMQFLETALKQIAGRRFKLFLKKHTTSKPKAIAAGAIVTAVLQSSSIVNIMVLAFVGAGVIQMHGALALMLGSNLGTTLTSWIIATLGFKLDIESFALPITGIAGLVMAFTQKESQLRQWLQFALGFGFLFLGLDFMKTGMEASVQNFNLQGYMHYPLTIFLVIGAVITGLIQASSATVALVLSALYVNAISLEAGAAVVLGSEIGTTAKLLLAAQGEIADKKRVALGNFLFNVITSLLVLLFLNPILHFITGTLAFQNNLMALALFQTLVNIIGILLFYPFLNVFGNFLQQRYSGSQHETFYIQKTDPSEPDLAIPALKKEIDLFLHLVGHFIRESFELKANDNKDHPKPIGFDNKPLSKHYEYLKQIHGDILQFYARLLGSTNEESTTLMLNQLISAVRNGMYAAKSINDARADILQLMNSSNEIKYGFFEETRKATDQFLNSMEATEMMPEDKLSADLLELYGSISADYATVTDQLYKDNKYSALRDIEISTLINFNRELFTAYKSYLVAIKDFRLPMEEAEKFRELPGFIR